MNKELQINLNLLLDKAMIADKADFGNIQVFNPFFKHLTIVSYKGFSEKFLEYFKVVRAFDSSACGRASGIGSTVIINDVKTDIGFKNHLLLAESEGFRAVKSIPLFSTDGMFVGIISTHFKEPQFVWDLNSFSAIEERIAEILVTYPVVVI